jgi:hypothetical protein
MAATAVQMPNNNLRMIECVVGAGMIYLSETLDVYKLTRFDNLR